MKKKEKKESANTKKRGNFPPTYIREAHQAHDQHRDLCQLPLGRSMAIPFIILR